MFPGQNTNTPASRGMGDFNNWLPQLQEGNSGFYNGLYQSLGGQTLPQNQMFMGGNMPNWLAGQLGPASLAAAANPHSIDAGSAGADFWYTMGKTLLGEWNPSKGIAGDYGNLGESDSTFYQRLKTKFPTYGAFQGALKTYMSNPNNVRAVNQLFNVAGTAAAAEANKPGLAGTLGPLVVGALATAGAGGLLPGVSNLGGSILGSGFSPSAIAGMGGGATGGAIAGGGFSIGNLGNSIRNVFSGGGNANAVPGLSTGVTTPAGGGIIGSGSINPATGLVGGGLVPATGGGSMNLLQTVSNLFSGGSGTGMSPISSINQLLKGFQTLSGTKQVDDFQKQVLGMLQGQQGSHPPVSYRDNLLQDLNMILDNPTKYMNTRYKGVNDYVGKAAQRNMVAQGYGGAGDSGNTNFAMSDAILKNMSTILANDFQNLTQGLQPWYQTGQNASQLMANYNITPTNMYSSMGWSDIIQGSIRTASNIIDMFP